jgi:hypothetical protein
MTPPSAGQRPATQDTRAAQGFEAGTALPPHADCVADSAGGLAFDVTDGGKDGPARLVLLRRGTDDEARLPLTPAADGLLRAVLPGEADLAEGRWEVHVQRGEEKPRRLAPGVNDLRALVDRVPGAGTARIAVRIPYVTKHGNLAVRSWLRAPHAEAGELVVGATGVEIHGRLHGAVLTDGAYAELGTGKPPEGVLRAGITAEGPEPGGFRCAVDYGALGEGVWKVWLRPAGEDGPRVRLGRLLDDIADKHEIYTYPKVVTETDRGPLEAGPLYTRSNDLVIGVTPAGTGRGLPAAAGRPDSER